MSTASNKSRCGARATLEKYKVGHLDPFGRLIFGVPCMMHVTTLPCSSMPWSDKGSKAKKLTQNL